MKSFLGLLEALLLIAGRVASSQDTGQAWRCTLLGDSTFTDDCLICGRPTFLQPLRGTFDLVRLPDAD